MKSAEPKTTASQTAQQAKGNAPFFSKEEQSAERAFFGGTHTDDAPQPFFSPRTIQPKLKIGAPNDIYEQQADSVADQVVARLAISNQPSAVSQTTNSATVQAKCDSCEDDKLQKKEEIENVGEQVQMKPIFDSAAEPPPTDDDSVQRKCADCEKEEAVQRKEDGNTEGVATDNLSSQLSSSKGGGSPLPDDTRTSMESAMGADFSNVRIHTGSEAAQMSQSINAQAFTHGSDVYFNEGKYSPSSSSGQHLLAHELTHTVQQGAAVQKKIQRVEWTDFVPGLSMLPKEQRGEALKMGAKQTLFALVPGLGYLDSFPRGHQMLKDLLASVTESPQYIGEILGEVWETVKEHWFAILTTVLSLMAAEFVIAVLVAIPEPTLLTKVVAIILQAIVLIFLGYSAGVELYTAAKEGRQWLNLAVNANGDKDTLANSSRSFLRMILHIILAILSLLAIKAKVRSIKKTSSKLPKSLTPKEIRSSKLSDGRTVRFYDNGAIKICASPCQWIRTKYQTTLKNNPDFEARLKAIETDPNIDPKLVGQLEFDLIHQQLKDIGIPNVAKDVVANNGWNVRKAYRTLVNKAIFSEHGNKHFKAVDKPTLAKSMSTGKGAEGQYILPHDKIIIFEREALMEGVLDVKPSRNTFYRFYKTSQNVGYADGELTNIIRVEFTSGVVHSHPMTATRLQTQYGIVFP